MEFAFSTVITFICFGAFGGRKLNNLGAAKLNSLTIEFGLLGAN